MALLPPLVVFVLVLVSMHVHVAYTYILPPASTNSGHTDYHQLSSHDAAAKLAWMRPQFRRAWTALTTSTTVQPIATIGPPPDTLTKSKELIAYATPDDEARGHHQKKKHHHIHHQKMHKKRMLYPVLIGLFIAKSIIFPMLLKALTIMSSASFMLSKMSLLTSILLGFKWFLSSQTPMQAAQPTILRVPDAPKVEVVHVPVHHQKKYSSDWGDRDNDRQQHGGGGGSNVQSDSYDSYYGNDHEPMMKPSSAYS